MALRFRLSELSMQRVGRSVVRRAADVPRRMNWAFSKRGIENRRAWGKYEGRHSGERCFIIANGPSLAKTDLAPLRDEITFGMNRIYIHFPKMGFETTYVAVANPIVVAEFRSDLARLTMPRFISWEARGFLPANLHDALFFKTKLNAGRDKFVGDPRHPISVGGTVTYATLQIAYFMGFKEAILVGLDHSFHDKGTPTKLEVRQSETDLNHFDPNYFPKGVRWELPDLRRSELAYAAARKAYEADGRRILDATLNGKCPSFEKVVYESVLAR